MLQDVLDKWKELMTMPLGYVALLAVGYWLGYLWFKEQIKQLKAIKERYEDAQSTFESTRLKKTERGLYFSDTHGESEIVHQGLIDRLVRISKALDIEIPLKDERNEKEGMF